jgi:hypothetical protein
MGQQQDEPRTRGSDKAHDKWLMGIALGVVSVENYVEAIQEERPTLTEVRIKCDPDDEQGVLVILKGYLGSQDYVAFHRDSSFTSAITSAGNRLRNGSLKWREDNGYNPS